MREHDSELVEELERQIAELSERLETEIPAAYTEGYYDALTGLKLN